MKWRTIFILVGILCMIGVAYVAYRYYCSEYVGRFRLSDYEDSMGYGFDYMREIYLGPIETAEEAKAQGEQLWREMEPGWVVDAWRPFGADFDQENQVWKVTNNSFLPFSRVSPSHVFIRKTDGKVLGFARELHGVLN